MAETTAISLAKTIMEGALSKLTTTAADEIAKMLNVREEVWYIRGELEMMQSFLMVAEAQPNDNSVLRTWFRQVKDLAYQIEDCLEEFSIHLENRDLCYKLRSLCVRRRIASDIRSIKAKVQEVSQRNLRYNLIKPLDSSSDITSRHTSLMPRMTALVVEETELVGQSNPKRDLIQLITEKSENKKVIWVVGMGGLGKTTLTKKVFDDPKIRNHFKKTIWITVSQNFDQANFIKQISSNRYPVPKRIEELGECVKSRLTPNYLVVLDDLWSIKDWNTIEYVFPDLKDSSVVVTTRNRDVAKKCGWKFKQIYPLEHLSYQDSFTLFLRKISKTIYFFENNKHMRDVIDKIINKCRGIPLVIVIIGGLLASKPVNKEEWEKVLTRLGSELEINPSAQAVKQILKQILDLSYIDLPYHLKPCLLYLSIFPEDHEIKRNTLVSRWIAEGYVRERHGMTLEEAAEEYFFELINRNLIQPFEIGDGGMIRSCKVHDIMRELILLKSIDENLISIVGEGEQGNANCRHLVVLPDMKELVGANLPNIRSVSIFSIAAMPDLRFLSNSKFRLLRVLELRNQGYSNERWAAQAQFMKHEQQLVHLKFLAIAYLICRRTLDLGNFRNLQTLEIEEFFTPSATVNIAKLQRMRHFIVKGYGGVALDKGIRNLKMLQSLGMVDIKRSHPKVIEELAELQQLKKLRLTRLNKCDAEKFSNSFSKLSCLRSLWLQIESEDTVEGCLDGVSSPPEHLRSIKLMGQIEKLPRWIPLLYDLAKITLILTRLGDDGIAVLRELPSLVVLHLYFEAYVGEKLIFENNAFPNLRALKLVDLKLKEMVFEEHSLPECETLEIRWLPSDFCITGKKHLLKLKNFLIDRKYRKSLDVELLGDTDNNLY